MIKQIVCIALLAASSLANAMFDKYLAEPDTPERAALRQAAPDIWLFVLDDQTGNRFYANPKRIKSLPLRGQISVWLRMTTQKPIPVYSDKPKPTYSKSMSQFEFNCESQQTRQVSYVLYDARGTVVLRETNVSPWREVVPDSAGEAFLKNTCLLARTHGYL